MSEKTKRIISIILMVVPSLMLLMSAIMKLSGSQQIAENMSKAGLGSYVKFLGCIELISVALFLYPKTSRTGFLLLCAYLGGALSIELSTGNPPVAAVILSLIWLSVFIRNKAIFLGPLADKKPE